MAQLKQHFVDSTLVLEPSGDWLIYEIASVARQLRRIDSHSTLQKIDINLAALNEIDTAGAYLLWRTIDLHSKNKVKVCVFGDHGVAGRLIAELQRNQKTGMTGETRPTIPKAVLVRIGIAVERAWTEAYQSVAFFVKSVHVWKF